MPTTTGTTSLGRQTVGGGFTVIPSYWILTFNLPHQEALLYRVVGTLYIEAETANGTGFRYEQRVKYPGLIGNAAAITESNAKRFVFDCIRPGLPYKFFTP